MNGKTTVEERMTRKRTLEAELASIRSQKSDVLRQIMQIAKKQKLGGPTPHPVAMSNETKIEAEKRHHAEQVRRIWGMCTKIMAEMLKNSHTKLYFGEPVHRDKFPGYYETIREPRDLGTIKSQIETGHFPDVYAFRDDVRLCFDNCRAFNPVGHPIRKIGDSGSDTFEKKWAQREIESQWEIEKRRHALAMERLEAEAKTIPDKIKDVDAELQDLAAQAATLGNPLPPGPGRAMTFEEKRRLSHMLGTLPGERLARVLEIIASGPSAAALGGDEECELDVDALDSDTLWKLQAYVDAVSSEMDSKAARPGAAAGTAAAGPAEPPNAQPRGDGSETDEVVESKGNADSTGGQEAAKKGHRGDLTTFVSATGPGAHAPILKNAAQKKDVQLQNVTAWANLQATPATANGSNEDGGAAALDAEDDTLWTEFQGREAQARVAEEQKKTLQAEEARRREEEAAAAAAAAKEAVEAEARRKAEAEDAALRQKEERRAREAEELERMKTQGAADAEAEALRQAGHGPADLTALGLAPRQDDEEGDDEEMMEI